MKENQLFDRNEEHKNEDDDQLRGSTMNETIREVNGDPDTDLNELRDTSDGTVHEAHMGRDAHANFESTGNISGARGSGSSGVQDMDDHIGGGRDLNRDSRESRGNLTPKAGTTGSDFDGQVAGS